MTDDQPYDALAEAPSLLGEASPGRADPQEADPSRPSTVCFLGASLTAGYGDPKGLGWVGRVVSRTMDKGVDLTAYNLGVRGQDSGEVMARWRAETTPRWHGERRLVVSAGAQDVHRGLSLARSRLNLANILDDASSSGIATFVVGLAPVLDAETNDRLDALAQAQADVCDRRGVQYVDCLRPLLGHDQWASDLAVGDGVHPGQAGYGLIAWLVLHNGWFEWMGLTA